MDFIFNTEESDLSPEKIANTYYNSSIGEFVIHFYTLNEVVKFAKEYDCLLQIESAFEDYDLPRMTVIYND
jgi:hypothetical protein